MIIISDPQQGPIMSFNNEDIQWCMGEQSSSLGVLKYVEITAEGARVVDFLDILVVAQVVDLMMEGLQLSGYDLVKKDKSRVRRGDGLVDTIKLRFRRV